MLGGGLDYQSGKGTGRSGNGGGGGGGGGGRQKRKGREVFVYLVSKCFDEC